MFESLERRIEQPEPQNEGLETREVQDVFADAISEMGNASGRTKAERERVEFAGDPQNASKVAALKLREKMLAFGLGVVKKVQERGIKVLDL